MTEQQVEIVNTVFTKVFGEKAPKATLDPVVGIIALEHYFISGEKMMKKTIKGEVPVDGFALEMYDNEGYISTIDKKQSFNEIVVLMAAHYAKWYAKYCINLL